MRKLKQSDVTEGVSMRERTARALLLFAAAVFTAVSVILIIDLNSSQFFVPAAVGSALISLSLVGLGMVVLSVFIDKWESRKRWLLSYTVLMAFLTFVIPVNSNAVQAL